MKYVIETNELNFLLLIKEEDYDIHPGKISVLFQSNDLSVLFLIKSHLEKREEKIKENINLGTKSPIILLRYEICKDIYERFSEILKRRNKSERSSEKVYLSWFDSFNDREIQDEIMLELMDIAGIKPIYFN